MIGFILPPINSTVVSLFNGASTFFYAEDFCCCSSSKSLRCEHSFAWQLENVRALDSSDFKLEPASLVSFLFLLLKLANDSFDVGYSSIEMMSSSGIPGTSNTLTSKFYSSLSYLSHHNSHHQRFMKGGRYVQLLGRNDSFTCDCLPLSEPQL